MRKKLKKLFAKSHLQSSGPSKGVTQATHEEHAQHRTNKNCCWGHIFTPFRLREEWVPQVSCWRGRGILLTEDEGISCLYIYNIMLKYIWFYIWFTTARFSGIDTCPEGFSQTSWVVQKADSCRCRSEIVLNAEVSHSWDEVAAVPPWSSARAGGNHCKTQGNGLFTMSVHTPVIVHQI